MVGPGSSTSDPELVRHWSLSAEPGPVARVRAEVLQQCASWQVDRTASEDVALVADELLGNAVKHGAGPLLLTLRSGATHVYVGVVDRAPDAFARLSPPDAESESGRGLVLVDALTTNWGSELQAAASKLVWATIPTSPRSAPAGWR